MEPDRPFPFARLRLMLADGVVVGPGKATLLEEIARTGSIAAAGRAMGMSYKRAWSLIEELNRYFGTPVVETTRGGRDFGGAVLTGLGRKVVDLYRAAEVDVAVVIAGHLETLADMLAVPDDARPPAGGDHEP